MVERLLNALRCPGFEPIGHQNGALAVSAVLRHGRAYQPAPLPKGVRRGKPRTCFETCAKAVIRGRAPADIRYVEGFMMRPSRGFIVTHAWLTRDGEAFDLTSIDFSGRDNADCLYYGIEFSTPAVGRILTERGCYGLLDPADEFVLSQIRAPLAA